MTRPERDFIAFVFVFMAVVCALAGLAVGEF